MGMGMGTQIYPLLGGDGDMTTVWYPLVLGMGMGRNFYYGDGLWDRETCLRPATLSSL